MNDIATLTPPQGWKLLNGSQKQRFINEHLSGAKTSSPSPCRMAATAASSPNSATARRATLMKTSR